MMIETLRTVTTRMGTTFELRPRPDGNAVVTVKGKNNVVAARYPLTRDEAFTLCNLLTATAAELPKK